MIPLTRGVSANAVIAVFFILPFCSLFPSVDAFFAASPPQLPSHRWGSCRFSTATPLVSDSSFEMESISFDDENEDVDEGDLLNTMDWDVVEEEELDVDADMNESYEAAVDMRDESSEVNDIFQEWLSIEEEERSKSLPKVAVIPQLFNTLDGWNVTMYNQLLQLISKHGSIRDAEALLYHMIQENHCVNDESFHHVYTSHTNHEKLKHSNRRNRRKWGTAFKLEQLLALQDALLNCAPSAHTLQAALRAMAEDRTDAKLALRAGRIWDRLLTLSNEEAPLTSAVPLLQACAHVPFEAAAEEKLAAFTIALEVFNGVTAESRNEQQSRIYVWFLRACRTLLAETAERKRDAVVEAAFRRACAAGVVNPMVLKSLSDVASDACMLRLLGGFIEDGFEVPHEWSRNCARQHSASSRAV